MNVAIDNRNRCERRWRLPLAWMVLIIFDLCLVALVCAQDDVGRAIDKSKTVDVVIENQAPASQPPVAAQDDRPVAAGRDNAEGFLVVQLEGPNEVKADAVRFEAIDVFVDSGNQPLAAYQVELASKTPGVEIVGIEGGEHAAFAEPPYYDSKAMNNNRVIIAAFTTGENLPAGRCRVARIHVQLKGPGVKEYETKLSVSATTDGKPVPAELSIAKAKA
ncbi:MAG TPA: hypothetical protein EYG03_25000 [Planctomycetes bacterium]|nr:hypothetical protein [Fuerstiella sp.]HIK95214.1 hypothetical protein [Planctomycetota bacterium]